MKNFGNEIVRKYRKEYLQIFSKNSLSKENNYGSLYPLKIVRGCGGRTANMPTFWEFAQWLTNDNNHLKNEHWIPVGNFCGICHNNYDYIIKIENFGTIYYFHKKKLFSNFENVFKNFRFRKFEISSRHWFKSVLRR